MIYNDLQKEEFIIASELRNNTARFVLSRIFELSSVLEEEKQKDICDFSVSDITAFYSSIGTGSIGRLRNYNSQLRMYTDYCIDNNLSTTNTNHFIEISDDILLKCLVNIEYGNVNLNLISRNELISFLDEKVKNFRDRAIFLGIFEGLGNKELYGLRSATMNDIDKHLFSVKNKHNEVEKKVIISEKLLYYIEESYSSTEYYTEGFDFPTTKFKPSPYIFKSVVNANGDYMSYNTFNFVASKIKEYQYKDTNAWFVTHKCLKESGRFDYIVRNFKGNDENELKNYLIHDEMMNIEYGKINTKDYVSIYATKILNLIKGEQYV